VIAEIDPAKATEARRRIPALTHDRDFSTEREEARQRIRSA
jgi:predicted amidohydrolase